MTDKNKSRYEEFLKHLSRWPKNPGVYMMRDSLGRILYIGKAKNLKNRARSYFQKTNEFGPRLQTLIHKVSALEYTVTHSEIEALLLECNLIKKHRPRYNVRLKDDKNFPYFVLDFTQPFPQFRITRRVEFAPHQKYFGPFTSGVRDLSRFLLKTFQIRDCSDSKFKSHHKRPCLNYEIGICTAPCVAYVKESEYAAQVKDAILFLKGDNKKLLKRFTKEMEEASKSENYEEAARLRDKILGLEKIAARQGAVLTHQNKDIDIIGYYSEGDQVQWTLLFVRSGRLTGRKSTITRLGIESLKEESGSFLQQYYAQALIPDEIWIEEDFSDRELLEKSLSQLSKKKVKIRVGKTESAIRLLGMAHENAKLLFEESKTGKGEDPLLRLKDVLQLKERPVFIEGIDVSNLGEKLPVVSVVHFEEGSPSKSRYRLYHPRNVEGQNDFAMIQEVVQRRYQNELTVKPDLILIDGGKGQLSSAVEALRSAQVDIPICSLAKAKTQSAFTRKEVASTEERIFIPGRKNPILLKENHPALKVLQRVRDEAHRFAISRHRRRREKEALEVSPLKDIRGIGQKNREKLLKAFGSIEAIQNATIEEMKELGISESVATRIQESLKGN